jgi:hypothetical protein
MTKNRTPTPFTHFEQVPLAAVKTMAHGNVVKAPPPAPHVHAVQFYESPDALCRMVGSFIGEGLEQQAVAVLIATPDHTARIEACLRECDVDVDALKRAGALVVVDARETLTQFMIDGMPNPSAFRRTVGGLLMELRRRSGNRPIRAYGEMVDLLWKDGREVAAIRLETLWNQLAKTYDFGLLCGYSMGNFYKGSTLDDIKRQHTHLAPTDGGAFVPTARPADAQA